MKKILVIGSVNMDYVMNVQDMPAIGETILCNEYQCIPGGKGANQAYAVAKLGGEVSMLGAVGKDAQGETLLENLKAVGVNVSRMKREPTVPSGTAFICVNHDGNNSIIVVQGANKTVDVDYIEKNVDLIKESDILLLQLEIPLDTVIYAAKIAKNLGKIVILDPAPAPVELPEELYLCVDYIKPNELELATLTGDKQASQSPELAAKALLKKGAKNAIVSLGNRGALLAEESGNLKVIPAVDMGEVIDTTAAGDSFTAAFSLFLSQEKTPLEAIEFASKVGGLVVTRKGAQSSIPTMAEVQLS